MSSSGAYDTAVRSGWGITGPEGWREISTPENVEDVCPDCKTHDEYLLELQAQFEADLIFGPEP